MGRMSTYPWTPSLPGLLLQLEVAEKVTNQNLNPTRHLKPRRLFLAHARGLAAVVPCISLWSACRAGQQA